MGKLTLSDISIPKPLIVILGPTASGKTELSYKLYECIDSEFISADSRQIYKYLNIGTAKPSKQELKDFPFHIIDFLEPDEKFSTGNFLQLAKSEIEKIYLKNKVPIIVGGTGLYIKALCEGFLENDDKSNTDEIIRIQLNKELELKGKDFLYNKLLEIDKESALKYSDKNPRRVIRALEFFYTTNHKFSDAHIQNTQQSEYNSIYFGIDLTREHLYENINQRCEKMWNNGLIDETKEILAMGFSSSLNSLNTVGYKEAISFINNKMSYEDSLIEFKKNTRHYAKRQLTFFRQFNQTNWLNQNIQINYNLTKFLLKDFIK